MLSISHLNVASSQSFLFESQTGHFPPTAAGASPVIHHSEQHPGERHGHTSRRKRLEAEDWRHPLCQGVLGPPVPRPPGRALTPSPEEATETRDSAREQQMGHFLVLTSFPGRVQVCIYELHILFQEESHGKQLLCSLTPDLLSAGQAL